MTSALRVSIETAAPPAASWRMIGSTRSISSPSQTGFAPGRVEFAADIDDRRAVAGHVRAGLGGGRRIGELAAVGKTVGRGVEDAHDLRLVEADGALAELQRRRAARSAPAIARPCRRRSGFRCPRPGPARPRRALLPSTCDQLDRREPVQAAGQPRDLARHGRRRIDEPVGRRSVRITLIARFRTAGCRPARLRRLGSARRARRASRRVSLADADLRVGRVEVQLLLPAEDGHQTAPPELADERIGLAHSLVDQGVARKMSSHCRPSSRTRISSTRRRSPPPCAAPPAPERTGRRNRPGG